MFDPDCGCDPHPPGCEARHTIVFGGDVCCLMIRHITNASGNEAASWAEQLPDSEWSVYQRVIREVRAAGIDFAFGGAFPTATFTGQLRNTKDFDFYIL